MRKCIRVVTYAVAMTVCQALKYHPSYHPSFLKHCIHRMPNRHPYVVSIAPESSRLQPYSLAKSTHLLIHILHNRASIKGREAYTVNSCYSNEWVNKVFSPQSECQSGASGTGSTGGACADQCYLIPGDIGLEIISLRFLRFVDCGRLSLGSHRCSRLSRKLALVGQGQ